jgi:hypothetical protein
MAHPYGTSVIKSTTNLIQGTKSVKGENSREKKNIIL